MTTTATANVARQEREERRERIATEQRRLDKIRDAAANEQRHAQIVALQAKRIAETVKAGSVAEFTVIDDAMVYRVRVMLSHEEVTARQAARGLVIAMAHLMAQLEAERIEAARQDAPGPNMGARLALILDGDSGRLCTR